MVTALEALDLDEMSDGRFVLGLGTGVRRLNEDWHNARWGKPVTHLRETVRDIRRLLGRLHDGRADRPRRRVRADAHPRLPAPLPGAAHRHPDLPGRDGSGADPARRRDRRRLDLPRAVARRSTCARRSCPRSRPASRASRAAPAPTSTWSPRSAARSTPTPRWPAAGPPAWSASTPACAPTPTSSPSTTWPPSRRPWSRPSAAAAARARWPTPSPTGWSTRSPSRAPATRPSNGIAAYGEVADTIKLTPPTHGLVARREIRVAQQEVIALIAELTGASR